MTAAKPSRGDAGNGEKVSPETLKDRLNVKDELCRCGHWAHDHYFLTTICFVCHCGEYVVAPSPDDGAVRAAARALVARYDRIQTIRQNDVAAYLGDEIYELRAALAASAPTEKGGTE